MVLDQTRASLELLYKISRELASSLDLHTVISRVLFLSIENVGAESGSLIVLDSRQKPVDAAFVFHGELYTKRETLLDTLEYGLAGWVLHNRQPALLRDTNQDERWLVRTYAGGANSKSVICIPVLAMDELAGILTIVHPTVGFFSEDHLALLQAIASQAGIAIKNARLYDSLQAAHRRYRELFEDNISPILITDGDGKIIEANRQAESITGYALDALKNFEITALNFVDKERVGSKYELLLEGRTITYAAELKSKEGRLVPVEVFVRRMSVEEVDVFQWICRDISERKALDALRNDLNAMVYHDLRSPLSNIISSLDMISVMLPIEQDETTRTLFSVANRSTDRLLRLVNSLLDINKLEAGQTITNHKMIDPLALMQDAFDAVFMTARGKNQELSIQKVDGLPQLWIDGDMIRRVLINLIENACKYTPPNGQIRIGAQLEGDWVELWVEDTGPGIPAEARERIFEKFARLPGDRFAKGLGLGLAFCRLAVSAHGGKIWVEQGQSISKGNGSRFAFTVPIVKNVEQPGT